MSNNKKVYFVLGSFKLGGTERTASRIGLELLKRGYDVKFLLINGIFDYDDPLLIKNSIVLTKNEKATNRFVRLIKLYFNLFRIVRSHKPDRLISFSIGINIFSFFLFYPKTIFRIESNIFIFKRKLYRRYLQDYFSRFSHIQHIIVPSTGLYEACHKYFKANSKLTQIDNPLDLERIELLSKENYGKYKAIISRPFIVSAGRLSTNKGFESLIKVYKSSLVSMNYNLVILGDGPLYNQLRKLITQLDIENKVFLVGFVKNPYIFFSHAKYFVLNSSHESFGNVLIEALACNIPVVSNDCDFGPRHIIENGHNGILYDQHNTADFKQALESLILDDDLYIKTKENACESKYKYSVDKITDKWIAEVIK
jgi:glycosyltransferase involved in cell wall biosynthesis